jgi:lipopolysaccharide/colanic/teichoic acid biosynthesis glycosyltransferase
MAFFEKDLSSSTRDTVVIGMKDMPGLHAGFGAADPAPRHVFYASVGKRAFDLCVVTMAIPFWLPLLIVGALLVMLDGHNPFYTQQRVGRNGRTFRMWKLRSMVPNADARLEAHLAADPVARAEWNAHQKLKNDPRITTVGRMLRKTSLDELPQLFNVLSGDMSLVGPRPIMVGQKALYPGDRYAEMRPGLTGLWQVTDRNECSFAQRARFDDIYYRALSFPADLGILMRTALVVVRGTGY